MVQHVCTWIVHESLYSILVGIEHDVDLVFISGHKRLDKVGGYALVDTQVTPLEFCSHRDQHTCVCVCVRVCVCVCVCV